jgi:hypothetical protein
MTHEAASGRPPISLSTIVARTHFHERRESSGFVHRSGLIFCPVPNPIRDSHRVDTRNKRCSCMYASRAGYAPAGHRPTTVRRCVQRTRAADAARRCRPRPRCRHHPRPRCQHPRARRPWTAYACRTAAPAYPSRQRWGLESEPVRWSHCTLSVVRTRSREGSTHMYERRRGECVGCAAPPRRHTPPVRRSASRYTSHMRLRRRAGAGMSVHPGVQRSWIHLPRSAEAR